MTPCYGTRSGLADISGYQHEEIKEYIRDRIETFDATERRWVVIIAGLGFFADAYSVSVYISSRINILKTPDLLY